MTHDSPSIIGRPASRAALASNREGDPPHDDLAADRLQFVERLLTGQIVRDLDDTASLHSDPADVVVGLKPREAGNVVADLAEIVQGVKPGGVVILTVLPPGDGLGRALRLRFPFVHHYQQRQLAGSAIVDTRYAGARVLALGEPSSQAQTQCETFIASAAPLPAFPGAVFEHSSGGVRQELPPRATSGSITANALPFDDGGIRSYAVGLVERLMGLEAGRVSAMMHIRRLSETVVQLERGRPVSDEDRAQASPLRFPWPLRDDPGRTADSLDRYERRPDDDYVEVHDAGERFMNRHRLRDAKPDFKAAAKELSTTPRILGIVDEASAHAPDVSIVIPIYGQLAFTLNCLDSLFRHASAYSAEIIVVDDQSPDQSGAILGALRGIRYHRRPRNAGFIASANAGAEMARGRVLVMLNNDTRVLPGWLDLLVRSFDYFPAAGLVGSKLLNPDGSLQEAGGIIWRDGSGWNFGRGDDPNRPIYSHARRADYISGASIAVPAKIWAEMGGFDTYFAPAYYEDVDLCFRLRTAGYETWYQSGSRLIHYEGQTSGTDTRFGVKAYQVVNARKFRLRHRAALQSHRVSGESPMLECDRTTNLRVLVVEATCPTPKEDAGSVYALMTLKLLRAIGYKPTFVAQDNALFQPEHTSLLQHQAVDCCYSPYQPDFDAYLRDQGCLFDLILVFRPETLERVIDSVRAFAPQAVLLYNDSDLHYLRLERQAEVTGSETVRADAAEMKTKEIALMQRVDCVITPSPFEHRMILQELPDIRVATVPLMVDAEGTSVGFRERRDICFLGGYAHPPNVDAMVYFRDEIFPLLRKADPSLKFIIAGANPTPDVLNLASEHIEVTGMIDDLRDLFDKVRVFVCPLRFGAGMKGKILSAMAYGVPVVSTSVGTEGIMAEDGIHLLVADTPAEIAAACLRLYRDEALWYRLSSKGEDLVRSTYSMEGQVRAFCEAIDLGFEKLLDVEPDPKASA